MLKTLSSKAEGWIDRWGRIVFQTKDFLLSKPDSFTITATEFLIGNFLVSYLLMFGGSFLFFAFFYHESFIKSTQINAIKDTTFASALFLVYVLLNLIALFVASVVSYGVYRLLRSEATFLSHVRSYFDLTALEPLVSLSTVFFWLSEDSRILVLTVASLVSFVLTRVWYLAIGFKAMALIHRFPTKKKWFSFVLGYLPGIFLLNLMVIGFVWFFLIVAIIPGWD